jgi:hypothetical protein
MIWANHCSFPWPCIPTLLRLQLRFATLAGLLFGSCRPRHTCPWQRVTPTGFITHCGNTCLGTLPPSLPQSIIDSQNRGIIKGTPPIPKLHAGRQLLWNGASVDIQEGKDTADSSVPFQTLWLTVFMAQESLATLVINPMWTFQLQWDLHHTLTMVPLPTILGQQPFRSKPLLHINYEKRTFCFSMQ